MNPNIEISRIERFLFMVFPLSVVVDLINGYLQDNMGITTPIGVVYRGVILCLLALSLPKLQDKRWKVYFRVLFTFFLLSFIYWIVFCGVQVYRELNTMVRFLYAFFMIAYFKVHHPLINTQRIYAIISKYGLLISVCIVFSYFTGLGNASYGETYGFGTKSYFIAGNDLGLTLLFSSVFAYLHFVQQGTKWSLLFYLTILCGMPLLGSRVTLAGAVLVFLISISHFIYYGPRNYSRKAKIVSTLVLAPIMFVGVAQFSFYIYSQFDNFALNRLRADSIMSARDYLTMAAKSYIYNFHGFDWVMGRGQTNLFDYVADYNHLPLDKGSKEVEADFYEMIGCYGIVGGLLCLFPFIYYAVLSVKNYFRSRSIEAFLAMFLSTAFIFISFSAGHAVKNVMTAPIYAILSVFLLNNRLEARR